MNSRINPSMTRSAILGCTLAWQTADAQLLSAYDGDEPGPRSWITDVTEGNFVGGPLPRAEALASDQSTNRIFASSGRSITTLELVAVDDFNTVSSAPVTTADGTTFRSIRSLAYRNGTLYAYNSGTASSTPPGGIYAVDASSGRASLRLEQALLPVPAGGLFSGMTVDPATNTLYVLIRDSGPSTAIRRYSIHALDPDTGASQLVVQFPENQFAASFDGLAFGNGKFYMTMGNIPRPIGVYNLATGQIEPSLPNPPRFGNGPGGATYAEFLVAFQDGPGERIPAPSGVSAFNSSAGVFVNWTAIRETNLAFVTVFRAVSPDGPFTPIAQVSGNDYLDRDTERGTTYFYFLTVTDTSGRESEPSRSVNVTTPGAEPTADTLSVDRIDARARTNRKGKMQGRGIVFVADGKGHGVSDVVVTGTFTGDFTGTVTALTNSRGRAVLKSLKRLPDATSFTICVEELKRVGFEYEESLNVSTCDSLP